MKILLTGKNGQVGHELMRSLQGLGEIVAVDRTQLDLSNLSQVRQVIRSVRPGLIVNAAAYTAVDKAESEPDLAMLVNAEAPAAMAEEAKALGAAMVHYSTDYVFDGSKSSPYTEQDITAPMNVYGRTKLAGEQAIRSAGIPHLIFRTSWIYGMRGKNFLLTMLRLAEKPEQLRVVDDQYGCPTWCRTVADGTAQVLALARQSPSESDWWRQNSGIYHLTSRGQTSWCGFAQAILEQAGMPAARVTPIATSDYPTPAKRPRNTVLSSELLHRSFCEMPEWETALRSCMHDG